MDLLSIIQEKARALSGHASFEGVKAVLRHIEVAERYLVRVWDHRDEDLLNDVVYRTNQAFEGILKEAYTVLTQKDGTKLSPHQIEAHLLQEQVFAPRVLELFKNYRQQWRNPSTHDHRLFFSEQESLLAIVSVSAFTNILLDQVIEAVNFEREQKEIERRREQVQKGAAGYESLSFDQQLIGLLSLFTEELLASGPDLRQLREVELIGRLSGFLQSVDSDLTIVREPIVGGTDRMRADLLLTKNGETVVVEVKRPGLSASSLERGHLQLLAYLEAGKWRHGILYMPPATGEALDITTFSSNVAGREVSVHFVVPKSPA